MALKLLTIDRAFHMQQKYHKSAHRAQEGRRVGLMHSLDLNEVQLKTSSTELIHLRAVV